VEYVASWVILKCASCHTKQSKGCTPSRSFSRGRGNTNGNTNQGGKRGNSHNKHDVHQLSEDKMAGEHVSSDDFYVFTTGTSDERNTLELIIQDKPIKVITDSGGSCNLMSEDIYHF